MSMKTLITRCMLCCYLLLCGGTLSYAAPDDLIDLDFPGATNKEDLNKDAETLINEAEFLLLRDRRPIDARSKLMLALKKDPDAYMAYFLLSVYFADEVQHYRLALKYAAQANRKFKKKYGNPPYTDRLAQIYHSQLLQLLSGVRLNLDDYQGALGALDEIQEHGYYMPGAYASRAWILMKLNRIDDALNAAQLGTRLEKNAESLNVYAILLSIKGERQRALEVFRLALDAELRFGDRGHPATPLNNSGEVYREIFSEKKAKESFLSALSLPDGCEHVLPSLNISMIYIDELQFGKAQNILRKFESCVARNFPLRNGEEHKALVNLFRGRLLMHTGDIDSAIKHFEAARARQQWFGKIGTSPDDMKAAVLSSLGIAYRVKNNHLATTISTGIVQSLMLQKTMVLNDIRSWWLLRKARSVLIEKLSQLEDVYIRHTDSMLEYPSLGDILAAFPSAILERRLTMEKQTDTRTESARYYTAYLGQNYLEKGATAKGEALLAQVLKEARVGPDDYLRLHTMLISLEDKDPKSRAYIQQSLEAFQLSRALLRNYGIKLPVNIDKNMPSRIAAYLDSGPFSVIKTLQVPYRVVHEKVEEKHVLRFHSTTSAIGEITVESSDLIEAVNSLSNSVFSKQLEGN